MIFNPFAASVFDQDEVQAHATVQQQFGEQWVHIPCCKPNRGQAGPDPRKPRYALSGIFDWDSDLAKLGLEETGLSTRNGEITFRACDLQFPVLRGDQLLRCKTGQLFEARDNQKDSASGVTVPVTQLGRAT